MLNFQDVPDELVLKILGYSEIKDIIIYGQVSRRLRRISHDGRLWVTANLVMKIVKTELLEMILSKGCNILNISYSTIVGNLSSNIKSSFLSLARLYIYIYILEDLLSQIKLGRNIGTNAITRSVKKKSFY